MICLSEVKSMLLRRHCLLRWKMGPESGLMMGVPEAGLEDFKISEWQEREGNGGSNNLTGKLHSGEK